MPLLINHNKSKMNIWLVISPFTFWGKYWWSLEMIITLYHNTHNFYCFFLKWNHIVLFITYFLIFKEYVWHWRLQYQPLCLGIAWIAFMKTAAPVPCTPENMYRLITNHNKVNQMHINQDSFQVCCLSGWDQGGSVWPCIWWSWPSVAVLKSSLWFLWDQGRGFMAVNISFYDIKLGQVRKKGYKNPGDKHVLKNLWHIW